MEAQIAVRKIGRRIKKCVLFFPILFFKTLPIDQTLVVFDNFHGKGYGCNPKYIAEALSDSGLKLVWLASGEDQDFPDYIRPVKYGSLKALRYLTTARVRVSNVRGSKGVRKRKGQFAIQTWHAMLWLKKTEAEDCEHLSRQYIEDAKIDGVDTDLMFANNSSDYRRFKENFWYSGEVLRCGLPRLRPILQPSEKSITRVRGQLGLQEDVVTVMYAPTFRGFADRADLGFDAKAVCGAIENKTQKKCVCLLRLHPNVASRYDETVDSCVINVSGWGDIQELIQITDYMITDYSSIALDSMAGDIPTVLYVPDLEEYQANSRQLFWPLDDLPFPMYENLQELCDGLFWLDEESIVGAYSAFKRRVDFCDDGKGDVTIAKIIEGVCHGER